MLEEVENKDMSTVDFERLIFRRQFLVGTKAFTRNSYWHCRQLMHGLILSHHCDLPVDIVEQDTKVVGILGRAYDALKPYQTQNQMARDLLTQANSIHQVILRTWPFAGRWVVIFQDQSGTYMFSDPAGLRQIFYSFHTNGPWIGSQPEIIRQVCPLHWRRDRDLVTFMTHPGFAQSECAWVGNSTIYEDCYHLLPNHYLNIQKEDSVRFYPQTVLQSLELEKVVSLAVDIFRGVYQAIIHREGHVLQALTGGWDSRILLAASRDVTHNITYFVDRHGVLDEHHPDVKFPSKLASCLGLNFQVRDTNSILPGWFTSILAQSTTCARVLPKTQIIYGHLIDPDSHATINGNVAEIARNFYDKYGVIPRNRAFGVSELGRLFSYTLFDDMEYVNDQFSSWKEELDQNVSDAATLLDLMYWEQRMGNWGAQFPAEQDIAIDEIAPFNCRLLLEILLSAPREFRTRPRWVLFRELIREMWSDTLRVPILGTSVKSFQQRLKDSIRPFMPPELVGAMREVRRRLFFL